MPQVSVRTRMPMRVYVNAMAVSLRFGHRDNDCWSLRPVSTH
jgi:hypothetical protein